MPPHAPPEPPPEWWVRPADEGPPCANAVHTVLVALDGQILTNTYGPRVATAAATTAATTNASDDARRLSEANVTADAPAAPPPLPPLLPGQTLADLEKEEGCYFGTCREFVFYRDPIVSLMFPRGGPTTGGFTVTAVGSRFDGMSLNQSIARCAFGNYSVPVTVLPDSGRLTCRTPPTAMAHLPFSVALNGRDFPHTVHTYRFYPQRLAQVWPAGAPVAGGSRVTLVGEGFNTYDNDKTSVACRFASAAAACDGFDEGLLRPTTQPRCIGAAVSLASAFGDSLVCEVPPSPLPGGAAGQVELSLALNGVDFLSLDAAPSRAFSYYAAPNLTSHLPRAGGCGTPMTLYGEGFGRFGAAANLSAPPAACRVGDAPPTAATIVSDTEVRCAAPPCVARCVGPSPGADGSAASAAADGDSLRVGVGFAVGLALNGADFAYAGAADADGTENATAAAAAAAAADQPFYVYAPPELHSVVPVGATVRGGLALTIVGAGFLRAAAYSNGTLVGAHDGKAGLCRFGGAGGVVAPGRALNDSAFVCELGAWPHPSRRAPAAETGIGQLPVEVSPNGVDFFGRRPARLLLDLYRPPTLSALQPAGGPIDGGTRIVVSGVGFDGLRGATSARCLFGDTGLEATVATAIDCSPECSGGRPSTEATLRAGAVAECAAPAAAAVGDALVFLSLNGFEFDTAAPPLPAARFSYYAHPVLAQLQPTTGPVGGRQLVTVAAHGLDNYGTLSDARCEFGGVRARAFVKTATAIVCAAPPHASGSVAVRVSLNGVDFSPADNALTYTYECSGYADVAECALDDGCEWCHEGADTFLGRVTIDPHDYHRYWDADGVPMITLPKPSCRARGAPCADGPVSLSRTVDTPSLLAAPLNGSVAAGATHYIKVKLQLPPAQRALIGVKADTGRVWVEPRGALAGIDAAPFSKSLDGLWPTQPWDWSAAWGGEACGSEAELVLTVSAHAQIVDEYGGTSGWQPGPPNNTYRLTMATALQYPGFQCPCAPAGRRELVPPPLAIDNGTNATALPPPAPPPAARRRRRRPSATLPESASCGRRMPPSRTRPT